MLIFEKETAHIFFQMEKKTLAFLAVTVLLQVLLLSTYTNRKTFLNIPTSHVYKALWQMYEIVEKR